MGISLISNCKFPSILEAEFCPRYLLDSPLSDEEHQVCRQIPWKDDAPNRVFSLTVKNKKFYILTLNEYLK